jgi:hypothetical protein
MTNANNNPSQAVLESFAKEVTRFAKEEVTIELINETLYVFGSELAILRIFVKYCKSENARQGYSENMKTFYFSLDI